MKKIIFEISEILLNKMDEAVFKNGFHSRSEYLRFLIMTHSKSSASESEQASAALQMTTDKSESSGSEAGEFANIDCEYGIPLEVIEEIKRKAGVTSC